MTKFHDLTPEHPDEGYRLWGAAVMKVAIAQLAKKGREEAKAAFETKRALIACLYGDDLRHIFDWHAKYAQLTKRVLDIFGFTHEEAGPVLAIVYEVDEDEAKKIVSKIARGDAPLN